MKIKNTLGFAVLLFLFASCQKDISIEKIPAGNQVDSTLLVKEGDHVLGDRSLDTITTCIFLYADSESPESRDFCSLLKDIVIQYRDSGLKIALVFRHFPMDTMRNHHRASVEARAAECISYQKHDSIFFAVMETFFSRYQSDDAYLEATALSYGLSREEFRSRMGNSYFKLKIYDHIIQGVRYGFKGAPTTLIANGKGKLLTTIEGKRTLAETKEILKPFL